MTSKVFFTGAGASKPFGYPLTKEIFPKIKEGLEDGSLFNKQADIQKLENYLNTMLPGYQATEKKDLPPITDVLSLVDHAIYVSNAPLRQKNSRDLLHFRELLEQAILQTLKMPYNRNHPPSNLEKFSKVLHSLSMQESVGIISTNYDIAIEMGLYKKVRETLNGGKKLEECFDFGISWRDPDSGKIYKRPENPLFYLYKLHGSFNWLKCSLCEHIYVNMRGSIVKAAFQGEINNSNTCHCLHAPLNSVIVAPSLVRDIREGNLLEIWKNSLELLRTSNEWIIIGYSFPSEDIAIRSLFIRAYQGREKPPLIRVIQKDNDDAMKARYNLFFPNCKYETGGMDSFINNLESSLS